MPTGARDRAAQARGHSGILDHQGCGSSDPISCGLVGDLGRLPVGNGASDSCKTRDGRLRTVVAHDTTFRRLRDRRRRHGPCPGLLPSTRSRCPGRRRRGGSRRGAATWGPAVGLRHRGDDPLLRLGVDPPTGGPRPRWPSTVAAPPTSTAPSPSSRRPARPSTWRRSTPSGACVTPLFPIPTVTTSTSSPFWMGRRRRRRPCRPGAWRPDGRPCHHARCVTKVPWPAEQIRPLAEGLPFLSIAIGIGLRPGGARSPACADARRSRSGGTGRRASRSARSPR